MPQMTSPMMESQMKNLRFAEQNPYQQEREQDRADHDQHSQ